MYSRLILPTLIYLLLIPGCTRDQVEDKYVLELPAQFPEPVYRIASNPFSREGFELGRRLFYDPILSRNGTISCGDCHQLSAGFAHAEHALSHGIDDQLTLRNSQHLVNLIWQKTFFWDGGVPQLDLVSVSPITNPLEMDNTMANVLETLRNSSYYQNAFKRAFPGKDPAINTATFLKALSQFMASLISASSPYDQFVTGQNPASFSPEAQKGLALFRKHCNACHTEPLFTNNGFHSNGLPGVSDHGRNAVTLNSEDIHKFKVPSLRNIEVTAPYMHDGRFKTLDEVLQFYSTGIAEQPQTDTLLYRDGKPGLRFTKEEINNLKAFLLSLTDKDFLQNRSFDAP
jgi:cytochrome c peroxidase